ncbi:MAG: exodeoxyribonuclease VII small subunit [Planctomycetota bacterium]|nr:exodeoxyribonuclease VII small subunit [Planctomycetota bacterium]
MASERGQTGGATDSFETMLEQIEAIVERIERGEVGLEQALAEHERGVRMIRACREILQMAEQRVETLNKDLERSEAGQPRPAQNDEDEDDREPAPF